MALSYAFSKLPYISNLSEGNRIIILTIIIILLCFVIGWLFGIKFNGNERRL